MPTRVQEPHDQGAKENAEALTEIVGVFQHLDRAELHRIRDFARALNERASDEVVFYFSRPKGLHIREVFLPERSLNAVWRGRPQTHYVVAETIISSTIQEPIFFQPAETAKGYTFVADVRYVAPIKGSARPTRRYATLALRRPSAERKARLKALDDENAARLRKVREEILAESVPVSRAAELIGRSEQTAINRTGAKEMLAFRDGVKWMFPVWQFDAAQDAGVVRGIRDVLRVLEIPAFSSVLWFRRPNPALDGNTPRNVLRKGDVDRVVELARSTGAF